MTREQLISELQKLRPGAEILVHIGDGGYCRVEEVWSMNDGDNEALIDLCLEDAHGPVNKRPEIDHD